MGQSYRIRTELGINKTINIQLDQEYEFLEILSLKIQQEDVYIKSCAEYGVVVGRVTANNGFGLPNARVSIFIPIESVDESNPVISSIYPYKSPNDRNEDGFRYNLLPYEQSYSAHAATGTLPTRLDNLTGATAVEIYDKYYKFTVKTNDSGDYMIMGVPQGDHTLVMDVDLSDIGEFSLTPQDLIRMGLATEAQVAGNRFRSSNDLNSLPQIINVVKNLEVSPLWGDPELCDIAINRVDFDLRDNANVDIQPTATFMGSIYSTEDSFRVRRNCKPRDNMGNLCQLTTGPGQLLAIRQTIYQDSDGNPVLEQYQLEQSGNIIDGAGAWLTELPMNLDYYITNEFGDRVISHDPTIGIPTKAKYRFKVKWQQPATLTQQTRRPYYLLPNVKEYGWDNSSSDPLKSNDPDKVKQLASSYYFGLAWSGYTDGFTGNNYFNRLNEVINCEDTFYQFDFNKVYTPTSLIDEYKKGARGRFIGIKEIDSQDCDSTINKFPVNDGFRNFDWIFFLFSIVFQILSIVGPILLLVYHIVAFLWNNFAVPLLVLLIGYFGFVGVQESISVGLAVPSFGLALPFALKAIFWFTLAGLLISKFKKIVSYKFARFKLSMLTYPDCQACECTPEETVQDVNSSPASSTITQFNNSGLYYEKINSWVDGAGISVLSDDEFSPTVASSISQAIATRLSPNNKNDTFLSTKSADYTLSSDYKNVMSYSTNLPLAERINVFNTRKKYFDGINQINVTFDKSSNIGKNHTDNTLTVVYNEKYEAGQLLTFVSPTISNDVNYLWTAQTKNFGVINGIQGTALLPTGGTINVSGASTSVVNGQYTQSAQTYTLSSGSVGDGESQCVVSLTINITGTTGTTTYNTCFGETKTLTYTTSGLTTIVDTDCIDISTLGGTAEYVVTNLGPTCQRYKYPLDIEYFQVLTALTINEYFTLTNNNPGNETFPSILSGTTFVTINYLDKTPTPNKYKSENKTFKYGDYFQDFGNQYVTILQRGVDPYSPLYNNEYGVGALFGYTNNDTIKFTASTRINSPIQIIPQNGISVQDFQLGQNAIFTPSHFFEPGINNSQIPGLAFSGFQTNAVRYYGILDSKVPNSAFYTTATLGGVKCLVSQGANQAYYYLSGNSNYDSSEDLSGGGLYINNGFSFGSSNGTSSYYSEVFPLNYTYTSVTSSVTGMTISNKTLNVMRTDRLPSSDYLQQDYGAASSPLLQQNINFQTYLISDDGTNASIKGASTGASVVTAELEGLPNAETVLASFSCERMVGLDCYTGFGDTFGIKPGCSDSDNIELGCYIFMNKPLLDLVKDLKNFLEWTYRFRFFYALCRGVLSQTFTNNWINGSLYMFPLQVDTIYDTQNKPKEPIFCNHLAYFDNKTTNFYYRSSPYRMSDSKFVGRRTNEPTAVNGVNLMFPTTIANLGYKDSFYSELSFDPSTRAYIIPDIDSTSYADNSDLVNLFVISRITDESFLAQILSVGDNSVNQLFSRPGAKSDFALRRVDGDFAQLLSINSEIGNINFSPEYYNTSPPTSILGSAKEPIMAVWFSSTTQNLQTKDYLTPGRIDFRGNNNVGYYPYPYGIKSQVVPFYQWGLQNTDTIFGNQYNNWATNEGDIVQGKKYQSLDRTEIPGATPSYFISSNLSASPDTDDLNKRGYIFSVSAATGEYSATGAVSSKFIVGAPFQFYFGIIKGESALDKFKTKYAISE